MRWFGRKVDSEPEGIDDELETEEASSGPWDIAEVPELGERIDLGPLRVPQRRGMVVKMELERKTQRIVAVNLQLGGSALQVQAFAAPRSSGLWEEIRTELATSITGQGGSVEEHEGPFGSELLARLPVRTPDGRSGHRPARFIGVDGPRWFLRGVMSGKAAIDSEAAEAIEQVLADIVVVRGHEARPPRDLLTLHMPGKPGQEASPGATTRPSIDLGSPRGPEITEVR